VLLKLPILWGVTSHLKMNVRAGSGTRSSILSLILVSDPDYTGRLQLGVRQPSLVSLWDCLCKRALV